MRATDAHRLRRRFDLARPSDRSAAIALGIAGLLVLLIWSPSLGGRSPGDPAAVATDPRLARCGGALADIEYAFPIPHARDYRTYLPAMERTSELEIEPAALVVIYRGPFPNLPSAGPSPDDPTLRNLCIYVGLAGQGELNYLRDISIAGLRATPDGPILVPARQN